MRNPDNVLSLLALKPDFIGFIFYNKSKRFVAQFPQVKFPKETKKVGVFVNQSIEEIIQIVKKHRLNVVQLHGDETAAYCKRLQDFYKSEIQLIKAFSVDENFDFEDTNQYLPYCHYFLFDTKGKQYGGNGVKFNWEVLQKYKKNIPFLLSGGITKTDVEEINKLHHPAFIGVDVNSGFEIAPALKNINDIEEFKNNLL